MYGKKYVIAVEGIQGSGKSEICSALRKYLDSCITQESDGRLSSRPLNQRRESPPQPLITLRSEGLQQKLGTHLTTAETYKLFNEFVVCLYKDTSNETIIINGYKHLYLSILQARGIVYEKELVHALVKCLPLDVLIFLDVDIDEALRRERGKSGMSSEHDSKRALDIFAKSYNDVFIETSANKFTVNANRRDDAVCDEIISIVANGFRDKFNKTLI